MPISFEHLQFQRFQSWGQHGFAFSVLCLPAVLAFAQQPAEIAPTSLPAEISKGSPALPSPDAKRSPAFSGPRLQTHPSPAAAANAQRAAREADAPSVTERQVSGDTVQEPAARPKRVNPSPRSRSDPRQ